MRIYMNFRHRRGPWGGGNQFLAALRAWLERHGHEVVTDPRERFDVALLNALMEDIDVEFVRRVAERAPVVHRKVGYRVSGLPHMRAVQEGVVHGDRLQIDFSPYLTHTVFQSAYSRDVFVAEGFSGAATIIPNGVNESIFNLELRGRPWLRPRRRVAELLKRRHVLLQLAREETCSNALIEGINCGLPVVYLDSGSNAELAGDYGVEYRGDFADAVARVVERYDDIVARTHDNPYRISLVAPRYERVLQEALGA